MTDSKAPVVPFVNPIWNEALQKYDDMMKADANDRLSALAVAFLIVEKAAYNSAIDDIMIVTERERKIS